VSEQTTNCPKCGAAPISDVEADANNLILLSHRWACGTVEPDGYAIHESTTCLRLQLATLTSTAAALAERVKGLEGENAAARKLLANVTNRGVHQRDDHNEQRCDVCRAYAILAVGHVTRTAEAMLEATPPTETP
jgi:hypothetical protein